MPIKPFTCPEGGFQFTEEMKQDYDENGFILVKGLFSMEEVKHVENALVSGPFPDYTYAVSDGSGKEFEMIKWSHPGNDVTGMVTRCEKVAGTCEKLMGGEVYHYHTKIMMKPAHTGGQHLWHQDYGYWYNYGFLNPDMITVFIAVDKCMKINGCLQVMRGSHKAGRVDHGLTGGQLGVSDLERVKGLQHTYPVEHVEMEQGDALFFHCNLLHCSSGNNSDFRRWAFITCFNKADNGLMHEDTAKYKLGHGAPLIKVPDADVLGCKNINNVEGKVFILAKDRPFPVRKIGKAQE